jgi:signal transduction histidine kinase
VGHRRRRLATGLLGGVAVGVVGWAVVETTRGGVDRPLVALVLALALLGSNLTPVVAIRGGRISAFTPVGALLVPIGLLLSAPTAILVYALGEVVGVPVSHRLEGRIAAPDRERTVRTAYTLAKSILGGTVGIVGMHAVTEAIPGVPGAVVAAVVGIALSSGFDHVVLAVTAVWVRGARLGMELRRDLSELVMISGGEIVAGALIGVLAGRDVWSLILGLGSLALLLVAATNYAHAVTERAGTRELLGLAHALGQATRVDEVLDLLLAAVRRLLPEDPVEFVGTAPDADVRAWSLSTLDQDRWLVIPRMVETRDYQEQPIEIVDAAVSLAEVALARAADQQRIVEQDQLRSLVLSTVAHDLRSPLTAGVGALQTLIQFDDALPADQKLRLLEMASRSVNRVARLVSDILGLEIAQQRPITRGPVDIATAVRDSVGALTVDATRRIDVRVEPATAAIDGVSLARIVENLVLNACKYSPSGGAVTVTGGATSDGGIELVVADEGPGVPQHERTTIFDAFEQAGRGHDGVGLGLFLARRFTELHDGRIWVDDAQTGGAAFHVWLPAGDLPAGDLPAAPAASAVAAQF